MSRKNKISKIIFWFFNQINFFFSTVETSCRLRPPKDRNCPWKFSQVTLLGSWIAEKSEFSDLTWKTNSDGNGMHADPISVVWEVDDGYGQGCRCASSVAPHTNSKPFAVTNSLRLFLNVLPFAKFSSGSLPDGCMKWTQCIWETFQAACQVSLQPIAANFSRLYPKLKLSSVISRFYPTKTLNGRKMQKRKMLKRRI